MALHKDIPTPHRRTAVILAATGLRFEESAMNLEGQTQFGDIAWAGERPASIFLDSAVAHGVGVTSESFSDGVHRGVVFLPDPKRVEEYPPLLVGKFTETVQRGADRFDHHLWGADRGGGEDGTVEHRDLGRAVGPAPQRHLRTVQCLWSVAQIVKPGADPNTAGGHPRHQRQNLFEVVVD